jgi:hypothetical protein
MIKTTPDVKPPYRYQDYPVVLYKGTTEHKKAHDAIDEAKLTKAGFTRTAPLPVGCPALEEPEDADDELVAAPTDKKTAAKK